MSSCINSKTKVVSFSLKSCFDRPLRVIRNKMLSSLESGRLVFFPSLIFSLSKNEKKLIDSDLHLISCDKFVYKESRNYCIDISGDSSEVCFKKSLDKKVAKERVNNILKRFAGFSESLLTNSFPQYAGKFELGETSFITGAKKEKLLHLDAFSKDPVSDKRILRIYTNIGKDGDQKIWKVGEDFS